MPPAFDKACAPDNEEIGSYFLIDECAFPDVPSTIVTPTDPPIPIPPIDLGCYPLVASGRLRVPNQSSAIADAFQIEVGYPTDDYCQPSLNFDLSIPCFVTFAEAYLDVKYDAGLDEAQGTAEAIDSGDCELGISLSIGLPCPTDLIGGAGTAEFDISIPAGQGETEVLAIPANEYFSSSLAGADCDFVLAVNLRLPCPTALTGGAGTAAFQPGLGAGGTTVRTTGTGGCDYELAVDLSLPCPGDITTELNIEHALDPCVARLPEIDFWVSQSDPDSCDFQLGLDFNFPCPVQWTQPETIIEEKLGSIGPPFGWLLVNAGSSSPRCSDDCIPKFQLKLFFPCPVDFIVESFQVINFSTATEGWVPWAREPQAAFGIRFPYDSGSGIDYCSPIIDLSLNLPCPVDVHVHSTPAEVNMLDSYFYTELPVELDFPERSWAFGRPQAAIKLTHRKGLGGRETPCMPQLDLSLNLPCPAGGCHRLPDLDNPFESMIYSRRQNDYVELDPDRAQYHPYYNLTPDGLIEINQTLEFFRDEENWGEEGSYGPSWAHGNWAKMEFDEQCQLDLDLSLYIPCGKRSPDVNFYDINDWDNPLAEPLSPLECRTRVVQDWLEGPFAEDCAFNEELQLFVSPGGGGAGGRFARITDKYGCLPPFVYSAVEVWLDADFEWVDRPGGAQIASNMLNIEEQGYGGQWVSALVTGDVVVFWTVQNQAAQVLYACSRSHYRGTF